MMDLIILGILLVFALVGYKRGFIREVITLVSSIVALVLAYIVYPVVDAILKVTALYTIIYSGVLEKIQGIDFGRGLQSQGTAITENINWLPKFLTERIVNNNNAAVHELLNVSSIQDYLSTYITNIIIGLIALLVTQFLIKGVLVGILHMMGGIIEHLPVISGFNRLGGFVTGILKGMFTLSIMALLIPIFITVPSLSEYESTIQASYLAQWIYKHNLVIWLYNYLV